MTGHVAGDAAERDGDRQVAERRQVEVERIRPDRRAGRDRRRRARPRTRAPVSVVVSIVLLTGVAGQTATCAWLMVTGPSPNSLEKRTRIWVPPSEMWTTWRKVRLLSGVGGRLPVSVSCGAPVQVPTQWLAPPVAARAASSRRRHRRRCPRAAGSAAVDRRRRSGRAARSGRGGIADVHRHAAAARGRAREEESRPEKEAAEARIGPRSEESAH